MRIESQVETLPSDAQTNVQLNSTLNSFESATAKDAIGSDVELMKSLDRLSIEDVVDLKISRFFEQIGDYYPDNLHDLMLSKVEKPLLQQILRRVGGNQVQASKILGINRNTLRKKIRQYGL
jgi:DNA-binding protein Fis